MGRPQKKIDADQVEQLAALGCSVSEIATVVKCSKPTLERRFMPTIEKGRERFKISLKRMQYESAASGSVTMQIWLGKQYLDQSNHVDLSLDEIDKRLAMELRRVAGITDDDDESIDSELLN